MTAADATCPGDPPGFGEQVFLSPLYRPAPVCPRQPRLTELICSQETHSSKTSMQGEYVLWLKMEYHEKMKLSRFSGKRQGDIVAARKSALVIGLTLISVFGLMSCRGKRTAQHKPHLLIYCGVTMVRPMTEIAHMIEKRSGCVIRFSLGGSGNLKRAIVENQSGDLYLPGASSYMEDCKKEGLVKRVVWVGCNQAALIVPEGNPGELSSDPVQLVNPDLYVALADPSSGSIGREAEEILKRRECYEQVLRKVVFFTTDSRGLTRAVKSGDADVAINWMATSRWPENREFIDGIPIDQRWAPKKPLLLGLLSLSKNREIAEAFMDLAQSPEGREIFYRYGFLTDGQKCPKGVGHGLPQ